MITSRRISADQQKMRNVLRRVAAQGDKIGPYDRQAKAIFSAIAAAVIVKAAMPHEADEWSKVCVGELARTTDLLVSELARSKGITRADVIRQILDQEG